MLRKTESGIAEGKYGVSDGCSARQLFLTNMFETKMELTETQDMALKNFSPSHSKVKFLRNTRNKKTKNNS